MAELLAENLWRRKELLLILSDHSDYRRYESLGFSSVSWYRALSRKQLVHALFERVIATSCDVQPSGGKGFLLSRTLHFQNRMRAGGQEIRRQRHMLSSCLVVMLGIPSLTLNIASSIRRAVTINLRKPVLKRFEGMCHFSNKRTNN